MIFIDDQQIAPEKLAEQLGITPQKYQRILKKPIFKLDPSKILKKRTINSPLAKKPTYGVIPSFWVKMDGISKRIRYAENQIPRVEGGITRYEYKPERINIDGTTVNLVKNPDLAFFMFINPGNPTSPFADRGKKKFAYMDTIEATKQAASEISNIQKALTHATTISDDELVILAKGLKVLTSDDYDLGELRVRMQQFAMNPATNKRYVQAMEDDMVRIEGRISNFVDKGIFKIQTRGSSRQWIWAKGNREGEYIGESIMNPNEDAKQRLFNAIKSDLGKYIQDLINYTDSLIADRKAREVLQAVKQQEAPAVVVPDHLAQVNAGEKPLNEQLVKFDDFKNYVSEKGYKMHMKKVKDFMTAVQEGEVTNANVSSFLMALFSDEVE